MSEPTIVKRGWRVHWDHPNGRDQFCGGLWPDVGTAEAMAGVVRDAGMLNVRIRRGSERVASPKSNTTPERAA